MKKNISKCISGALLCAVLALGSIGLAQPPQQSPVTPSHSANSMTAFWEKFKGAVIRGDKGIVAALSRFPISMGYGMSSLKNKAQLVRRFRHVFFNETDAAKCFPRAKPYADKERPKEFIITCSFASSDEGGEPFEYRFTLTRNGWKFTSFENINE